MIQGKWFYRWSLILGVVLIFSAAAACGPNGVIPGTGPAAPAQLVGTAWVLTELRGQPPLLGVEPTLAFDGENVGGDTGCNSFGGNYQTGPDKAIQFGELFQTEIFCMGPEGVMEQESEYMNTLHQAAFYQMADNRLELQNQAGETILVFERE